MKASTATSGLGSGFIIEWLWNDCIPYWTGVVDNYPVLELSAAAGIAMLVIALVTRWVDKLD